jgi:hypothetical protein
MIEKILAFISSTSDLKAERQAVKEVVASLKIEPFLYEEVSANSASPEDFIRGIINKSEIYVGLLGGKYGSVYPPRNDRSIVEFEFDEARARPGLHLTAIFPKALPPEEIEPRQQELRTRAGGFQGIWLKTYDSIEKLKSEVRDSIAQWLATVFIERKTQEEPIVVKHHRKLTGIAGFLAGTAALLTLLSFTILPIGVNSRTAAIAIGCFAIGILLCIVVVEYLL